MSAGSSSSDLVARGDASLRNGRFADAIEAFTAALALSPTLPETWFNLAWVQRAERRFDDAIASYAKAIEHGVARPEEARLNRAVIFSEYLFDPEQAEAELRAALALDPDFVEAALNLANLHEDLGRSAEAEASYRRVLTIDPGHPRAHARLATIATFKGNAAQAVPALEAALALAPTDAARAEILFPLGAALDDLARYDEAFQAFEAANWYARSVSPVRYDAAAQERLTTICARQRSITFSIDG